MRDMRVQWLWIDHLAIVYRVSEDEPCPAEHGWIVAENDTIELEREELQGQRNDEDHTCFSRRPQLDGDPTRTTALLHDGAHALRILRFRNARLESTSVDGSCRPTLAENFCGTVWSCEGSPFPLWSERPSNPRQRESCVRALRQALVRVSAHLQSYDQALEHALPFVRPAYVAENHDDENANDEEIPSIDVGITRPETLPSSVERVSGARCVRTPTATLSRARPWIQHFLETRVLPFDEERTAEELRARQTQFRQRMQRVPLRLEPGCQNAAGASIIAATHTETLNTEPVSYRGYFRVSEAGATVTHLSDASYERDVVRETFLDLTGDGIPELFHRLNYWELPRRSAHVLATELPQRHSFFDENWQGPTRYPHRVDLVSDGTHHYVLFDWQVLQWNGTTFAPTQNSFLQPAFERRNTVRTAAQRATEALSAPWREHSPQGITRWNEQLRERLLAVGLPDMTVEDLLQSFRSNDSEQQRNHPGNLR